MRILIGGTAAAVLAAVVVGVFALGGGGVSLANAADRMQGKSLRANVTLAMNVEGVAVKMKGTVLQSADLKRMQMETTGEIQGTDIGQTIIVVDDDLWVGGAALASVLPEGKRWVHAGADAMADLGSMSFEELMAFCEAASDVEKRGETKIDGVDVTHYAGKVDFEAAAKKLGKDPKEFTKQFGDGEAVMPIEVWVDEAGDAVRAMMGMTVDGGKVDMTMDHFEYDVPTDSIKAPPTGEVVSDAEVGMFSDS
jgi:hypothetical protein